MKKIWKNFFRKSGRISDEVTIHCADFYVCIRSMEYNDYETRLQADFHFDKDDQTVFLTSSDARRLGEALLGYAKAFGEIDKGHDLGYREHYMQTVMGEKDES